MTSEASREKSLEDRWSLHVGCLRPSEIHKKRTIPSLSLYEVMDGDAEFHNFWQQMPAHIGATPVIDEDANRGDEAANNDEAAGAATAGGTTGEAGAGSQSAEPVTPSKRRKGLCIAMSSVKAQITAIDRGS